MREFIVGGFWLEKGEEGGGESPWFCAAVLGGRRWSRVGLTLLGFYYNMGWAGRLLGLWYGLDYGVRDLGL